MAQGGDRVSITVNDYEDTSFDSDAESPPAPAQFTNLFAGIHGIMRLDENRSEYGVIKRCLLEGMGLGGLNDMIVVVHKISTSSVDGKAKLEVFRTFLDVVATKRGDGNANVRQAWYGGSCRNEVSDIIRYGFGVHHGHGVGIPLSPATDAIFSALKANKDENGLRHMLLCRVILGNTEIIQLGSKQSCPSSPNFDSGIDNAQSPRKYIVWTPYMNSHILPEFIISFKGPVRGNSATRQIPPPSIYLHMMINMLSRYLEPSKMDTARKYYNDFRESKIQRFQLRAGLSTLVGGDNILRSLIILSTDFL